VRIEKLTTHIGAELAGVNLAEAATNDDLFGAIREALLAHKVLFLRDQDISKADHVAFASRFGELESHPVVGSDPDHPGLV
jgi:taurine dioxygenase